MMPWYLILPLAIVGSFGLITMIIAIAILLKRRPEQVESEQ